MAGFNVKSIQPQHLAELLQDQSHKANLERGFFGPQMIGPDYTHFVDRLKGSVDKAPISLLAAPSDTVRTSLVATDSPTPKGNAELDVLNYTCNEYRYAMSLNEVIYSSPDAALRELEQLLRLQAGARVKVDSERDLLQILNGSTGSTPSSLTGKEWNAYSDADHNPVKDILDAISVTGGGNFFAGRNVWNALKQSPKLTGSTAGGGVEFLTDAQLVEKLLGLGLANVWVAGYDFVNGRALNLSPQLTRLHDGIAAVWAEGAIHRFIREDFQYDLFEDRDTRKVYFRALETSCYESAYAESVVAFTNILL
jgi:hypothetical protein